MYREKSTARPDELDVPDRAAGLQTLEQRRFLIRSLHISRAGCGQSSLVTFFRQLSISTQAFPDFGVHTESK